MCIWTSFFEVFVIKIDRKSSKRLYLDGVHTINQQRMRWEPSKLLADHEIMYWVAELFSQNHFIVLRRMVQRLEPVLLLGYNDLKLECAERAELSSCNMKGGSLCIRRPSFMHNICSTCATWTWKKFQQWPMSRVGSTGHTS